MSEATPKKVLRRPPPSHKAANADLRQEVVRVWRERGRNAHDAARALGMSESGVRHYLDQAREEWKQRAAEAYELAIAEELSELNSLSGEAWTAWLAWKGKPDSKVLAWKFLEIAEKCSASRRALLGLDRPVKVEIDASHFVGDPDRRDLGEPMTLELASMILSEHGLLQSRPGFDPCEVAKRLTAPHEAADSGEDG
jgi:predicted transcriptional regulator